MSAHCSRSASNSREWTMCVQRVCAHVSVCVCPCLPLCVHLTWNEMTCPLGYSGRPQTRTAEWRSTVATSSPTGADGTTEREWGMGGLWWCCAAMECLHVGAGGAQGNALRQGHESSYPQNSLVLVHPSPTTRSVSFRMWAVTTKQLEEPPISMATV